MNIDFNTQALAQEYCERLTKKILPFWLKYGIDTVHGGIYTGLDRDGSLIETDKSVWFQGRALWTFATSVSFLKEREKKCGEDHSTLIQECLSACENLIAFIEKYCTDESDGRMYFRLTADGQPVIKRLRYAFSESFAVVGYAAYACASGKAEYAQKAFDMFNTMQNILASPDLLVPKFNATTRPSRGFGLPMILLNTTAELRLAFEQFSPEKVDFCTEFINNLLEEIKTYFVKEDLKVVLEQCAYDGSVQHDHLEGRQLNPGHAIEGAWFIIKEGVYQKNQDLQ
ncbi:MAG: AGE family epimerase/isomerase, partial [Spirochaetales bacterium]